MTYAKLMEHTGQTWFDESLFDPASPDELDERGCFSKQACADIDVSMLAFATQRVGHFTVPEGLLTGSDPNNKWRTISCLQKAIRFGDVWMAMNAANAAYDMDPAHLLKRLGVISAEDVSFGNMSAAAVGLAMLGNSAWRKSVGERRMVVWLARELAAGMKDRTLIDMLVWAAMDKQGVAEISKWSDDKLADRIADKEWTCTARLRAAWMLAGTAKFGGFGMPKDNARTPTRLFRTMAELKMTRFGLWFAARVCSRLYEPLFVVTLLADEWVRGDMPISHVEQEIPNKAKVGKLLGACYDQYTREGRSAINKFFKEDDVMRTYRDAAHSDHKEYVLYEGVFLAEQVLDHRVTYGENEAMHAAVTTSAIAFHGMLQSGMAASYLPALRERLPLLNAAREKVLYATLKGKK